MRKLLTALVLSVSMGVTGAVCALDSESRATFCLGGGMGVAGAVCTQALEKAEKAYDRGDYATALKEYLYLADRGNEFAQVLLPLMFGKGEPLRKAAERGYAEGQRFLGYMYERGIGDVGVQNYKEAVAWYRKAAEQGNASAQNNLGLMYANGRGVAQNYKEAVTWYRKSAEQGNASAQNNLAMMYDLGRGVVQHYVYAHMWYNIASSNGRNESSKLRDAIAAKMTPGERTNAQELAIECEKKKYKRC